MAKQSKKDEKHQKEDQLRYQAVKELQRSAKSVKTLLLRKLVRKCKQLKEDDDNKNKYDTAQKQLLQIKNFGPDTFQTVAHDLIYGTTQNPLENLKNWDTLKNIPEESRWITRDVLRHKTFQEVYSEQTAKIKKAMIPYKSKRQRQVEENALRKEAEGATVRQKHKQNVGIFIESLEDATVTDVMPVVRKDTGKNKGTKGVPRHLRQSHIEERKRQRQPDLSVYGPESAAAEFAPKVSHGNRVTYGEGNANKKVKTEKAVVSNNEWKKAGIHPSWAAKQKLKTQSALIGSISLSTKSGNKITFSED